MTALMVEMNEEFKSKLRHGIIEDSWLGKMKSMVEENNKLGVNAVKLLFRLKDSLLIYVNRNTG